MYKVFSFPVTTDSYSRRYKSTMSFKIMYFENAWEYIKNSKFDNYKFEKPKNENLQNAEE